MKYKKLTGIILKKQNYKEADQIITLWTKEAGKIRVKAVSVRLPKSKLTYSLHELSVVAIEVTGSKNLPTVINAQSLRNFRKIREDLISTGVGLYACELLMKITADEHPNPLVFDLFVDFLSQINEVSTSISAYQILDNFSLSLAEKLGFGAPEISSSHVHVKTFIESILERNIKSEAFLMLTN